MTGEIEIPTGMPASCSWRIVSKRLAGFWRVRFEKPACLVAERRDRQMHHHELAFGQLC
jgi:hypothetical protein